MKKILFFLIFAFAIFLPKTFYPQHGKPVHGFKIAQKEFSFLHSQSGNDNSFFTEDIEDLSDENPNGPDRKNLWKTTYDNATLVAQIFSDTWYKRILSSTFSFFRPSSLFIYLSVFRL